MSSKSLAPSSAMKEKNFDHADKFIGWQRLADKDREKVMDNVASHEDWKSCFSEFGPGLLLFARQWARSAADAEDIVQEAFVKFWRRNHKINNRALLVLKIWNELTFNEIGDALGISQNTAASRYRYALANLKKNLQPQ